MTITTASENVWPDPAATDFTAVLPKEPGRCRIPAVEDRGITSSQLHAMLDFARKKLAPAQGSIFNRALWVDTRPQSYTYHQPVQYMSMDTYHANAWIIRPATRKHSSPPVSYVELISSTPQRQSPRWFVSHAWIQTLVDFVMCLDAHCRERGVGEYSSFWICAYCNNQNDLVEALQTSFFRAMLKCEGILLVLDETAAAFTRIWCCFEIFLALDESTGREHAMLLDICASKNGKAHLLLDGLTEEEQRQDLENLKVACTTGRSQGGGWGAKSKRESAFPLDVLWRGLSVQIETASASEGMDKIRILNAIAARPPPMLDEAPDEKHYSYSNVSRRLHGVFAVTGWRAAVEQNPYSSMVSNMLPLQEALLDDRHREVLTLCFLNCPNFQQEHLDLLAQGLPYNRLKRLHLDFGKCEKLRCVEKISHALALMSHLTYLNLDFLGCHQITNVDSLAHSIGHLLTLRTLHVSFRNCYQLEIGFDTLHKSIGKLSAVSDLSLIYSGCDRFTYLQELGESLMSLDSLVDLTLEFYKCYELQDSDILASVISSVPSLSTLKLNLHGCFKAHNDEILTSIAMHQGLESIELTLANGQLYRNLLEFVPFKGRTLNISDLKVADREIITDVCEFVRFVGGDWCLKIHPPWLDYLSLLQSRDLRADLEHIKRNWHLTMASLISDHTGSRLELRAENRKALDMALAELGQPEGVFYFYQSQLRLVMARQ